MPGRRRHHDRAPGYLPYGVDPQDSNIRIAPSLPPIHELGRPLPFCATACVWRALENWAYKDNQLSAAPGDAAAELSRSVLSGRCRQIRLPRAAARGSPAAAGESVR
ncbi:MAG: hypothetical protein ACLU38_05435 [Dysosmobacter sp.]